MDDARIDTIERDISDIRSRIDVFAPSRENDLKLQDLKLQMVNEATARIEVRLQQVNEAIQMIQKTVQDQDTAARARDAEIISSQNKLQIRVLVSILSSIFLIFSGLAVGYGTHLLH